MVLKHPLTYVTLVHDKVHKIDYVSQVYYHYHVMLTLLFAAEV